MFQFRVYFSARCISGVNSLLLFSSGMVCVVLKCVSCTSGVCEGGVGLGVVVYTGIVSAQSDLTVTVCR